MSCQHFREIFPWRKITTFTVFVDSLLIFLDQVKVSSSYHNNVTFGLDFIYRAVTIVPIYALQGQKFQPTNIGNMFLFFTLYDQSSLVSDKITSIYCLILEILGQKCHFSLYNQPKTKNIYKTLFPPCSKTPLISETCIYITNNLCKWRLGTQGGMMFHRQKIGEGQLKTVPHEIPLQPTENYINCKLFDKIVKFCILVVLDLTNDIIYDDQLNRSKTCHFRGKMVKIM